ncbi:MAG TPA: VOC family protein [Thermoanaerobaculia bacterium]|nr:VOC family protein [Thermoanaerobaculia bacterium]
MTEFTTYLSFDGNCREAMRFYETVLNGKLAALITNGETPAAEHVPPGNADRIMHAYLVCDGFVVMAGDSMVGQHRPMQGFHLTLSYTDVAEAQRVYDALSEGGTVEMPFQPTFWAERFGMLTDRFGTPWIINGGNAPEGGMA